MNLAEEDQGGLVVVVEEEVEVVVAVFVVARTCACVREYSSLSEAGAQT